MKNILSIALVSIILMGCSDNRVFIDELTNRGDNTTLLMYYEGDLFTGVGFDVHPNGQLELEFNFKDGKQDGLQRGWYGYCKTNVKKN
jgi:antitoxin component YwqK of YwqJK toxin-antitoxin module